MKVNSAWILLCVIALSCQSEAQIFDRLFGSLTTRRENNNLQGTSMDKPTAETHGVSIPGIYEMIKSGNSLGINVLSGLVKVERGVEAERSGLSGRRPISVRVFGIPVYERGNRIRGVGEEPDTPSNEIPTNGSSDEPEKGEGVDDP